MTESISRLTPKVAVCLAAYNGARWLDEQIDSILGQTGVSVTLFVSVDCSSDDTLELIDRRAAIDARIRGLPYGERFGGAARNFFRLLRDVDFSGFDYVSLADQDDVWFADKLARAHMVLLRQDADAYSSNVMAFWPSGQRRLIKKSQPQRSWDFLFEAAGPGCTYVLKSGLARVIQTFLHDHWDEVQAIGLHDWLIYAFTRANGYCWFIDDHVGMLYRQHERNQVGANDGVRALVYRAYKVLKNGWGMSQVFLIARLVGLGDDRFVRRWIDGKRGGLMWLALNAWQCRRRVRDRAFLFIYCLLAACAVGRPVRRH